MSATDPTYLELCVDLRIEVGASGSGPLAVTGQTGESQRLVEWIASAQMKVETKWDNWDFLHTEGSFSTVASTREYSLTDMSITDHAAWDQRSFVYDPTSDSYSKLTELSYEEWKGNQKLGTVVSDIPTRVVIKPDRSLILYPTPNAIATVTMDYWSVPVRMTADGNTSAIPAQYRRIIVLEAKMMYGEFEDAPEIYQGAMAERDEMMEQLMSNQLPSVDWKRNSEARDITVVAD